MPSLHKTFFKNSLFQQGETGRVSFTGTLDYILSYRNLEDSKIVYITGKISSSIPSLAEIGSFEKKIGGLDTCKTSLQINEIPVLGFSLFT